MGCRLRRKLGCKNGFKAGNTHHSPRKEVTLQEPKPVKYVRPTLQDFELLSTPGGRQTTGLPITVTDSNGQVCDARYLRPKKNVPTMLESSQTPCPGSSSVDNNRIYHRGKLIELFQESSIGHKQTSPHCDGVLEFDKGSQVQRGLAWKE